MFDFEIPPQWSLMIYHRADDTWRASLVRGRYAKGALIVKGEGISLDEALKVLKQNLARVSPQSTIFQPNATTLH